MLGVLGTYRLPYPSRSFDMAHCSRCLVPWTQYDGLYLMEIDRILRPGGYWVLSGPPINWRNKYTASDGTTIDPKKELTRLEDLARRLCWRKLKGKARLPCGRNLTIISNATKEIQNFTNFATKMMILMTAGIKQWMHASLVYRK
ncbi:putative S-adenosyl-L-methionine-dependent methyltransferase [Helianthus annuus]|nr:putative S-adenosyl-L-methionine-dependent methyltransferase [Helianthus annuus]